jgi:hypothetical protein
MLKEDACGLGMDLFRDDEERGHGHNLSRAEVQYQAPEPDKPLLKMYTSRYWFQGPQIYHLAHLVKHV